MRLFIADKSREGTDEITVTVTGWFPVELADAHPRLFEILCAFYRQDPRLQLRGGHSPAVPDENL